MWPAVVRIIETVPSGSSALSVIDLSGRRQCCRRDYAHCCYQKELFHLVWLPLSNMKIERPSRSNVPFQRPVPATTSGRATFNWPLADFFEQLARISSFRFQTVF